MIASVHSVARYDDDRLSLPKCPTHSASLSYRHQPTRHHHRLLINQRQSQTHSHNQEHSVWSNRQSFHSSSSCNDVGKILFVTAIPITKHQNSVILQGLSAFPKRLQFFPTAMTASSRSPQRKAIPQPLHLSPHTTDHVIVASKLKAQHYRITPLSDGSNRPLRRKVFHSVNCALQSHIMNWHTYCSRDHAIQQTVGRSYPVPSTAHSP